MTSPRSSDGLGRSSARKPAGSQPESPQPSPEKKSRKKRLPKVVSRAEADSVMRALDNGSQIGSRNHLMAMLMYRAGLRVSEVVGLKLRDIERDGIIRLYNAKGGDGTAYFDTENVLPLLDHWLGIRQSWIGELNTELVFVHQDGTKISTRYLQRLMKKIRAQLGITGKLTPHVLRHSYATELLEEGFTLVEVQSSLRHANLATTSIYLHVRDETLRKKMSRRGRQRPEGEEVTQ